MSMKRSIYSAMTVLLRGLLPVVCVLVALVAGAVPAHASGHVGGSGGGGTTQPTVPPIQLGPDSPTLASGASEFIQVVVNPAAPAAGETLSVAASNASLTVPTTVFVSAGFNAQFEITANSVTAATPVTVTVRLGTAATSVSLTVTPPTSPALALSTVDAFPRVVAGGDAVTVSVGLAATAPPGGFVVALHSDSALLPVPATLAIPVGSTQSQLTVTAGSVTAITIVHLTATLAGKTVIGQLEIDPARVLTGIAASPNPTDASQVTTGGVSMSVPADGDAITVALHSSNPAVASVPALTGFGNQDSGAFFPITITAVTAPTTVTISATAFGATISTTLTVVPVPPPPFAIDLVTVSPTVVAGNATATGTITATTAAPAGGATVKLSTSDTKLATVPATVVIPAGATSVTFPIKVTGSGATDISIGATFDNLGHAAPLGVTGSKGGSLIPAFATNQVLETRPVNDVRLDSLGFYSGGVASIESGQLPPGVSLISNLRPGEFVFHGSPQKAGTYTFVLKFNGNVATPYALAYVWVITPA
jgi:trimeric autotransporter adhesin